MGLEKQNVGLLALDQTALLGVMGSMTIAPCLSKELVLFRDMIPPASAMDSVGCLTFTVVSLGRREENCGSKMGWHGCTVQLK